MTVECKIILIKLFSGIHLEMLIYRFPIQSLLRLCALNCFGYGEDIPLSSDLQVVWF